MTYFERMSVSYYDSVNLDAFSRLRISNPETIFESKHIHDDNNFWDYKISGSGTKTFIPDESSVDLFVTSASGDSVIKQSRQYFPYQPDKSQLIIITFKFSALKENLIQRVGYFDSENGVFLEANGMDINIVLRTKSSGVVSDTVINQSSWNIDELDGTGESKYNINMEKSAIFIVDLQWGVGRVRTSFDIDGVVVPCHAFKHSGQLESVYMTTGSLPIRYEIQNTGNTSSGSTLKTICASVSSEGVFHRFGLDFSTGNGRTLRNAGTGGLPILALRPKSTLGGKINRRIFQLLGARFITEDENCFFELVTNLDASSITGATWTSVNPYSGLEYSTDINSVAGGTNIQFFSSYAMAGSTGPIDIGGTTSDTLFLSRHNNITLDIDGNQDEMFIVYAYSHANTTNCGAQLNWVELE